MEGRRKRKLNGEVSRSRRKRKRRRRRRRTTSELRDRSRRIVVVLDVRHRYALENGSEDSRG